MKYNSTSDILPYSDRKLIHNQPPRWTCDEIVKAQCMACEGIKADKIAAALGRGIDEVMRVIDPEPPKTSQKRQTVANVGFQMQKRGW